MIRHAVLLAALAFAGCCPVYSQSATGTCNYPGSTGNVLVDFDGGLYSTPSCWEAAGGWTQEAVLESDNIAFGQAGLGLSVVFYPYQSNEATQPACVFQTGMTVPLTSSCLSLTATGTNTFIATAGDSPPDGGLIPTGSLTLDAWPGDAGGPLSITFSSDATLLYFPALNGGTGSPGLLSISGSASGESIGPVSSGDTTSD